MICNCEACKASKWQLHIGDRVVFSGNIPGREMHAAKYVCENAGLRIQGSVTKDSVAVVVYDVLEESNTVKKGRDIGARILTLDQLRVAIGQITPNARMIKNVPKSAFETLPLFEAKIYPIGLDDEENVKFRLLLKQYHSLEAQQIRPSVTAAVFGKNSANSGIIKIFSSEGVPSYDINSL